MVDETIGIVGGVGPYAGTELANQIFGNTIAKSDQEHLSVVLLSQPNIIPDRTKFLLGEETKNPGEILAGLVMSLEKAGCGVAGIPCNTAHAPAIFDVIKERLQQRGSGIQLLHMLEEVVGFLKAEHPTFRRIGVLSTTGTWKTEVYVKLLQESGLTAVVPDEALQAQVHDAIYNEKYGIKAQSAPVKDMARQCILYAITELASRGAEAVILGCTELPLAVPEREYRGIPLINPSLILAQALIRAAAPEKLKPLKAA